MRRASQDPEIPEGFELVNGDLVEKETSGEHARAQGNVITSLNGPFGRRPPGGPPDRPGGWWFGTEALILFRPGCKYRPDVAGWRRDRVSTPPAGPLITEIPDWICEIISPGNASHDTITKMEDYHRARVAHYWLLDPRDETLEVYRWTSEGYLRVLGAKRGQSVHAEPFQSIPLSIGVFFGDDEE